MSYLLFQASLFLYVLGTAAYIVAFVNQSKTVRRSARLLIITAAVVHTGTVVLRYVEAGHTPLVNNHEAVSFFALSMAWAFLSFYWRYKVKNLGTFVTPVLTGLMLVSAFSSRQIPELPPALRSTWLPIHASIAILANGFLALAFCGAVMYLLQERAIKKKSFGVFFSRLPSLEALDTLNHHCLTVGFPLLTLGIITGSIWAEQAWGSYWHWDPKETWSLITWFLYAALLHQRFTVGWRGRRAAIMAIVGFSAVLFTFWGVTYLLQGVHTYAG
ncbi:MAG: c-type cytochrome biogenesis protein CcsB [Thermodesulfobacteriota bacterium]